MAGKKRPPQRWSRWVFPQGGNGARTEIALSARRPYGQGWVRGWKGWTPGSNVLVTTAEGARTAPLLGGSGSDLLDAATSVLTGKTQVKTQSDVKVDVSDSGIAAAAIVGVAFVAGMFMLASGRRKPKRRRRSRRKAR